MGKNISGGKILKVVKQRCKPHLSFFPNKAVTIVLFKPPESLTNKQMLAQYGAAVTSTNQKVKTFEFLGCEVNRLELSLKTTSWQFAKILKNAASNPNAIGIIIQNPIPSIKLKDKLENIPPHLDIDGINKTSIFKASATSEAVSRLVISFSQPGDRVAIVGSMGFVGKGVVELLKSQDLELIELDKGKGNTLIDIKQQLLDSDIVVSAAGKANLIQSDFLKPEHKLVIDTAFIPQSNGTVMGDVSKNGYDIPQLMTPVPGGVGPTQMAVLLERIMKVAGIKIQPWDYQDILIPRHQQQQQRVERVAPILLDYLQLHQERSVENDNSIVKFDSDTKTISYQSKSDRNEQLKAQYQDGQWLDRESSISSAKESYFLNDVAPQIKALLARKPHQSPPLSL